MGSSPHSGEVCGSRMMPDFHSALVSVMCRLDGRLFFLDSDDLIRISGGFGVVGGVENVSPSGDDGGKVEGMAKYRMKLRNVRELAEAYKPSAFAHPGSGCDHKQDL